MKPIPVTLTTRHKPHLKRHPSGQGWVCGAQGIAYSGPTLQAAFANWMTWITKARRTR